MIWEMVGWVSPITPITMCSWEIGRVWSGRNSEKWKPSTKNCWIEACNFLEWKRNRNALQIHLFFLGGQNKDHHFSFEGTNLNWLLDRFVRPLLFRLFISLLAHHFRCPGLLPHRQWSGYRTSVAHGRMGQNRTYLTSSLLVSVRWMNFWEAQNGKEDWDHELIFNFRKVTKNFDVFCGNSCLGGDLWRFLGICYPKKYWGRWFQSHKYVWKDVETTNYSSWMWVFLKKHGLSATEAFRWKIHWMVVMVGWTTARKPSIGILWSFKISTYLLCPMHVPCMRRFKKTTSPEYVRSLLESWWNDEGHSFLGRCTVLLRRLETVLASWATSAQIGDERVGRSTLTQNGYGLRACTMSPRELDVAGGGLYSAETWRYATVFL